MLFKRSFSFALVFVFALVLGACGGGGSNQTTQPTTDQTSSSSSGKGTIQATVKFEGTPPEPKFYDASGNSECGKDKLKSRKVVVNDNGTLKNVVVAVKSGPSGLDKSAEPVSVDQVNCMYEPHVVTAKTGQTITYKDSDPSMHNVRAIKKGEGQIFNITTFQGSSKQRSFSSPGVYSLECNVHPWMQGWVYVTEHGYASVTDDSGKASLSGLPAGEYTLTFWHEKYGTKTKTVNVKGGDSASVTVSFNS